MKMTTSMVGGRKAKPESKKLVSISLNKRIEKIKITSSTCVNSFVTSKTILIETPVMLETKICIIKSTRKLGNLKSLKQREQNFVLKCNGEKTARPLQDIFAL